MGALEKERRGVEVGSNGCFLKVMFGLIHVYVAASADESMTLTLRPHPELDPR